MMTSQQITELIDEHEHALDALKEQIGNLQMDNDELDHKVSVLVRQGARAHALLDNDNPDEWPESIRVREWPEVGS